MKLTDVSHLPGDDVLTVVGVADDGAEVTASGWVTAMANYFPPESYYTDADGDTLSGHLKPGSTPREMTADEKTAYWLSLLPHDQDPVVLFQA